MKADDIENVGIAKARVHVNGKPFLPVYACGTGGVAPCFLERIAETGVNIAQSEYNGDEAYARRAAELGLYLINMPAARLADNPVLLYWMLPDEVDARLPGGPCLANAEAGLARPVPDEAALRHLADVAGGELAGLRAECRRLNNSRLVFLNFSYLFLERFWGSEPANRKLYSAMAENADVISWDIYPVADWNRREFLPLVAEGVRTLRRWFPAKPIHIYLECVALRATSQDPSEDEMRNELWQAVAAGAAGIGWFYGGPAARHASFAELPLKEVHIARLRRLNAELLAAADVVFGEELAGCMAEDVVFSLRNVGGRILLLAVNASFARRPFAVERFLPQPGSAESGVEKALQSLPASAFDELAPLEVRMVSG